jgi:hypothetical protein
LRGKQPREPPAGKQWVAGRAVNDKEWHNMKKISDDDIKSGRVMGPILCLILALASIGACVLLLPIRDLVVILLLAFGSTAFCFFVMAGIPRIWNGLADLMARDDDGGRS